VTATETAAGMSAATAARMTATGAAALSERGLRNEQQNDQRAERCPHVASASEDGKGSAAPSAD
jgi:hypothetical protein